jgi:acetyltransferase-like isoleucine patch superfamily enzyme
LRYNINKNSSIGFLTIINSKDCKIEDSQICSFNYIKIKKINIKSSKIYFFNIIKNFYSLTISQNSILKNKNKFYGEIKVNDNSKLEINENCQIGSENFFDLSGNIKIKDNCKILNYCQFWTHGFNSNREIKIGNIEIGENVILENSVTIISDIKITSNCIIKISSIVNRSLLEENTYSSNILIKK